jgi:hypothetical protein
MLQRALPSAKGEPSGTTYHLVQFAQRSSFFRALPRFGFAFLLDRPLQ